MSEPAEYETDRVSRAAGEAIFTRTGLGDPYVTGVPYPIFLALVRAFPRTFGADMTEMSKRFGFLARNADPHSDDPDVRAGLPVGWHLTTDPNTGVAFMVHNCALCHTERVRWTGGEATVVGLGNKRIRIHTFDMAFASVTTQRGFTVEKLRRLAREAAREHQLTWPDQNADALIGATIAGMRRRADERTDLHARVAPNPPGRVATIDAFVPALRKLSGKRIEYSRDVAWAKVPDVIGFRHRTTLSWDGTGQGPMSVLLIEADIAAGARIEWFERHPLQGASLDAFLRTPASRPVFPGPIDRGLADKGRALFEQHCSDCHGRYAANGDAIDYDEPVVPLADIGTDPARAHAASDSFERVANDPALTRGYTTFRRTFGYVPPVLTNVWARAPYGHAGQWPSLAVLARAPDQRPVTFTIDLDAPYDLDAVGVATRATTDALRAGEYVHDASTPGFAVGGHPFLADLGADAAPVIEYLKTL